MKEAFLEFLEKICSCLLPILNLRVIVVSGYFIQRFGQSDVVNKADLDSIPITKAGLLLFCFCCCY